MKTPKSWLFLGLALLALTGLIGYQMWTLPLWGYRPLVGLLACWGGVVAIGQFFRMRRGKPGPGRRLLLSILSGVLLGIGFPDILPLPFLLFGAWVPLLVLEQELAEKGAYRKRLFIGHVFNTVLLWNIIATYWVTNTAFAAGLFANIVNSMLMCLPWLLFVYTKRVMPKIAYAALIVYWLTFEYGHLQWELTWPWLTLGNSWAEYPSLVQWYEYTGVFGGGLWIWVVNVHIFQRWASPQRQWRRGAFWQTAALILLPMLASLLLYANYAEVGDTAEVVVVQPNYEPHYQKFEVPEREQAQRFIDLSLPLLDSTVDYLVFPETSFGFVREKDPWNYGPLKTVRRAFSEYLQLNIVTGLNAYHDFGPSEKLSPNVRYRTRNNQSIAFEVMNLAGQLPIDPDARPQTYRKSKLVPGAEIFPFRNLLFFMEPLVDQLGGSTAGLGTQAKRSVFTSEAAAIAPAICYESIFGEYFAGYVRAGAQAAFIMTNDGWWDNTAGHRQHLYFASLRAIETRRAIARSANTGVSAFINQRGDISQATGYEEPAVIRQSIVLNDEITFYTKWGDLIARFAIFMSILFLLNTFVKGRLKK